MSYRLREQLDQATLDKLYGLKRRLKRGKLNKSNKSLKETSYVKRYPGRSPQKTASSN